MRNVIVTRKVELALTADDWSLYGDNDGHLTDRRIEAAREINKVAEQALNNHSRTEAYWKIRDVLDKYSKLGAADTEGYAVMHKLLDTVYGEGAWCPPTT